MRIQRHALFLAGIAVAVGSFVTQVRAQTPTALPALQVLQVQTAPSTLDAAASSRPNLGTQG